MKAAKFDYVKATTLEEAFKELASGGMVRLMAGSQTLGPMLNLRLVRAEKIVDISAVEDLRQVTRDGDQIKIGAGVRHAEIEDGVYPELRGHPLQTVAARIAYRGVRNRGTIGGSLVHADPAADWVVTLAALGARVELTNSQGQVRTMSMDEFMVAAYTTEILEDEILTAVLVPAQTENAHFGYYKFARKVGEFADASSACYFNPETRTARVVLGALDGAPRLLPKLAAEVASKGKAALDAPILEDEVLENVRDFPLARQRQFVTVTRRCIAQLFD